MKRTITTGLALSMSFFMANFSFGQLKESQPTNFGNNKVSFQQQTSSPNLHHHHDGKPCLTDALTKEWIEQAGIEEQYQQGFHQGNTLAHQEQGERATYTIPIVFHVVHNPNNPAENVSQNDINELLDRVNADFSMTNADIGNVRTNLGFAPADADIQFCLAMRDPQNNPLSEPGINRVSTNEDFYDPDTEANKMKSSTGGNTGTEPWNRNKYINVWICDITNGASFGTAGYAYKPTVTNLPPSSIDGIVIDYNIGMGQHVLSHEIGHFLGLSHTWGNSNQAAGCSEDDGLNDTPNTAGPSFDFVGSCSGSQQTCPGTETQYENFMDYSNCTAMFTTDQANLMAQVLQNARLSLTTSNGCVPVNPTAPTTDFVADITSVIQGGSVNFSDLSTDFPTSWTWTVTPSTGVTFIGGTDANSQNPTMQFANTGTYTVELTAANGLGSDAETKTNYITVNSSGGGTTACDTLRNYTPGDDMYTISGVVGYVNGNEELSGFQVEQYAEMYTSSGASQVRRLRVAPARVNDGGGSISFNVYSNNGGEPGAIIQSQTVALADLQELFINTIDFATPASVNGDFWVGYTISYANPQDTFALLSSYELAPTPNNDTYMFINSGWTAISSVYGSGGNFVGTSVFMDVLTSNGPAPTAVVSFPTTETCEGMDVTMNAFGSTNTTYYYWDISDGTNDYFFDEANLTTPFGEGNWTIQLNANGSCQTDLSPVFNLTVNPPLTGNFTTGDENCVAQDGTITFNVSGGDGGTLDYSINNGASFNNTGSFTDLEAGDYNYIIRDQTNCELTGTVTVDNVNNFSPTISSDVTITQGSSTTLTVTGGNSWSWFADNTDTWSGSSITVSPDVTTTYYCTAVDANGCEATLEVTVTVTVGIEDFDLTQDLSLYPNPNNGQFTIDFGGVSVNSDIKVLDVFGKVVKTIKTANAKVNVDLSNVAQGVYFVKVIANNKTVVKKISVKK